MSAIKKIYFIGGTSDFSSQIVRDLEEKYNYQVTAVGRRTGHKLGRGQDGVKKVLEEFKGHDAVINYTFAGGAQYDLMIDLYQEMMTLPWNGYFINFGSTIVLHHSTSMKAVMKPWEVYKVQGLKKAIQYLGHEWSRKFHSNPFRYTAIQCGMLDNEKMRALPNYRTTCLKAEDLANVINYCLSSPENWHLHEIMLDGK